MSTSGRYGWPDYLNVAAQMYQARQQSAIQGTLQNQLDLMNYQIQLSERISRGRRALIEYESLIEVATEVFESYPHYAYSILSANLDEFNGLGLAGTFFAESEDMRNAIRIQRELNSTLERFRQKLPRGFEKEIDTAYDTYHKLQKMEKSGFKAINDALDMSRRLDNMRSSMVEESEKLVSLEDEYLIPISEATDMAKERGRKSKNILIYSTLALSLVNYVIVGYFVDSVELVDDVAIASAVVLATLIIRHWRQIMIPRVLDVGRKNIPLQKSEISYYKHSISNIEIELGSFLTSLGVRDLEELQALPQVYSELLSQYFPREKVFPVVSVSSII